MPALPFVLLLGILFAGRLIVAAEETPVSAEVKAAPARVIISVADQLMAVVQEGRATVQPISTSKFGIGDEWGSYKTPLGRFRVCEKLGGKLPLGAVLKNRGATGEVLEPNAPGRDPIVTRILWLEGLETRNSHAHERAIYIHGTPEEARLGQPASWGCVRMSSCGVAKLYEQCESGTVVTIEKAPLGELLQQNFGDTLMECPALPGYAARVPAPIAAGPEWQVSAEPVRAIGRRFLLTNSRTPQAATFTDLSYTGMLQLQQPAQTLRLAISLPSRLSAR